MTNVPPRRSPLGLRAPAAGLALLALAGCGDEPRVQPSADPVLLSRLEDLETRLREVEDSHDVASVAGSSAGLQAQSIAERLLRAEKQLEALQRAGAAAPQPADGGSSSETPSSTSSEPSSAGTAFQPVPADQPLPEEQVLWWRRLEEEARRRRAEEQQIERFKRDIARSKAVLTPEQEAAVVKLESAYAAKVRELYRAGVGDGGQADRDAMNAKRQALFAEFETQVRATIPASEADKIITTLQERNRGFYGGAPRVRGAAGMQ
jgi:hypothetical protein